MAQMRLRPDLAVALDAGDVWNACQRPWMGWYQADPVGMRIALERDSRGRPSTIRLGAYELAVEWFSDELLEYEDGQELFQDAMATLRRANLGSEYIRMFELPGFNSAG